MAWSRAMLAGLCILPLFKPLESLLADAAGLDAVSLLQDTARIEDQWGRLVGQSVELPWDAAPAAPKAVAELRAGVALLQDGALIREGRSRMDMWLPSLAQIITPVVLVGCALLAAAMLCSCKGKRGACCYFSGCCGVSLVVLAIGLIIAKLVIDNMAGPAPAGPVPMEPPATNMDIKGRVPFTVTQINTPGPIHEAYKKGMQHALDESAGAKGGAITVLDVEAQEVTDGVVPPVMISNIASNQSNSILAQKSAQVPLRGDARLSTPCKDDPPTWQSSTGYSCQDYAANMWCTAKGGYGKDWGETWGTFQDYATHNQSAVSVCCQCGGGFQSSSTFHVSLTYTLKKNESASLKLAPTPQVTSAMVNTGIKRAAKELGSSAQAENSSEEPQALQLLAEGSENAVEDADVHVSVEAHIRCQASHRLNPDLQDALRIVLKKKLPEVTKALEEAAGERGTLPLSLSDRCNDPAQQTSMSVCIGQETLWADFVSNSAVHVPSKETEDSFLCRESCSIAGTLKSHKDDAIQEINEKLSGFSLDQKTFFDVSCSPFPDKTQSCPPCPS